MAVEFTDGTHVSDSISVFRVANVWYLPLGELADALSVELKVSVALKKAEGFLLEESNRIAIDLSTCEISVKDRKEKFDCANAVIYNDEVYITSAVVNSWWSLKTQFLQNQSLIVLSSDQQYPAQARLERERRTTAGPQTKSSRQVLYELQPNPRKNFSGPSIDQQLTARHQEDSAGTKTTFAHDTSLAAELLGYEASGFLGGVGEDISQWSMTFSKKDPDGGLFLKAREFSVMDVLAPPVPLVSNNSRVRGLLLSSYPLLSADSFSFREFTGILPSGWEVELYQNDTLIGRQVADDAAEFNFKDVPLYYGLNRFKLIYYGPQGQRREELELVNIDPNMALPKQRSYKFVSGQEVTAKRSRTVGQYTHSLGDSSSLTASYLNAAPQKDADRLNYGQLHLLSRFGRHLIGMNGTGNDEHGTAYEGSIQTPFENASLGLRHAVLDKFRSEVFNSTLTDPLTQVTRANIGYSVPYFSSLRLTGEAQRRTYKDERLEWQGVQRTSLQVKALLLSHSLTYDDAIPGKTAGQFDSNFLFDRKELRFHADYQRTLTNVGSNFQWPLSKTTTFAVRAAHELASSITDVAGTVNKTFKHFIVGTEVESRSNGDFAVQALLSYGSMFNPVRKTQTFFQRGQAGYGAANVLVFLDINQNKIRDEGEPGLENIRLLINNQDASEVTSKDGYVLLSHLPTHQPVNLSVSFKSIPDPSYRPLVNGKTIILRPGGAERLELPIGIFGEVSGVVNVKTKKEQKGKRGVIVQLLAADGSVAQSTKTESDGYYAFDSVSPGNYVLRIKPDQLKELSFTANPKSYEVQVQPESPTDASGDFILSRIENLKPNR